MIVRSIRDVNRDKLVTFACGNKDLDNFLIKHAYDNDDSGYGKTFLLEDEDEIVGFFTLCSANIKFDEFPINDLHLPRYPIPAIRIARLAVKKDKQGKGYGKEMLKQSFLRILTVAETVGIRLVVVDAKKSSASFYEKYGFLRLMNESLSYYLLLDTIKEAIR